MAAQARRFDLVWQVSGLALLFHVGSPQSKDGNDRLEEKVDLILKAVADDGDEQITRLDRAYHRDGRPGRTARTFSWVASPSGSDGPP